ncbi:hypothetical protein Hanom_Chr12g01145481 [Helianthus anomalus]
MSYISTRTQPEYSWVDPNTAHPTRNFVFPQINILKLKFYTKKTQIYIIQLHFNYTPRLNAFKCSMSAYQPG